MSLRVYPGTPQRWRQHSKLRGITVKFGSLMSLKRQWVFFFFFFFFLLYICEQPAESSAVNKKQGWSKLCSFLVVFRCKWTPEHYFLSFTCEPWETSTPEICASDITQIILLFRGTLSSLLWLIHTVLSTTSWYRFYTIIPACFLSF